MSLMGMQLCARVCVWVRMRYIMRFLKVHVAYRFTASRIFQIRWRRARRRAREHTQSGLLHQASQPRLTFHSA
eukprot:2243800-Alexandrium_andersonii.AAC.1